jgi:hypothetical protein
MKYNRSNINNTDHLGEDFRERKLSMVLKKPSETPRGLDRRSSLQNPSRFQALRDAFINSSKKVMSPTPDSKV